jgi:DNA-binding NarL/FixJ family response regulator
MAVSTIEAARAQCADQGAGLCLINADLQNRTGLPMPARLTTLTGRVSALAYSVHADSDAAFVAPQGGLSNYFYKRLPLDRLLEPIQTALNHAPVSFESLRHAAQSYFRSVLNTVTDLEPASASVLLTPREQQVLGLLCKGHVDKEIAAAMGISPWTVRGHLKHVFAKLQVRSRIEAMLWSGAK